MSKLTVKGKITEVLDVMKGEGKNGEWAKRTIIVKRTYQTDKGEFHDDFVFDYFKNGEYINYVTDGFGYSVGDEVNIEYTVKANKHNEKWYGSNNIWNISKVGGSTDALPNPIGSGTEHPVGAEEDEDILPF